MRFLRGTLTNIKPLVYNQKKYNNSDSHWAQVVGENVRVSEAILMPAIVQRSPSVSNSRIVLFSLGLPVHFFIALFSVIFCKFDP